MALAEVSPIPVEAYESARPFTDFTEMVEYTCAVVIPDFTDTVDWGDQARMLAVLRSLIKQMQDAAAYVEDSLAANMPAKELVVEGLGVIERHTGSKRTQWDNDAVQRVVTKELAKFFDGDVSIVEGVLTKYREVARPSWLLTGLRALGVDPDEYCETSWGRQTVSTPAVA